MSVTAPRLGTDIVSVPRIGALLRRSGPAFLARWFSPAEVEYCLSKAHPERHLAARLAAKEAVVKVLRAPWDGPLPWRGVEVVHERGGPPSVRLSGRVLAAARDAGVGSVEVSLSHCDEFATAVAFAVPGERG
jgi:holo-[acyl-carrier protein] synthase